MAINACTIDGFTLHGRRCRDKFTALIPILHPPTPTGAVRGSPRVLRDTYAPQFEFEEKPMLTFEQPFITVQVIFDGVEYSQQLNSSDQLHFVTITGLQISAAPQVVVSDLNVFGEELADVPEVVVNITDLEL